MDLVIKVKKKIDGSKKLLLSDKKFYNSTLLVIKTYRPKTPKIYLKKFAVRDVFTPSSNNLTIEIA